MQTGITLKIRGMVGMVKMYKRSIKDRNTYDFIELWLKGNDYVTLSKVLLNEIYIPSTPKKVRKNAALYSVNSLDQLVEDKKSVYLVDIENNKCGWTVLRGKTKHKLYDCTFYNVEHFGVYSDSSYNKKWYLFNSEIPISVVKSTGGDK